MFRKRPVVTPGDPHVPSSCEWGLAGCTGFAIAKVLGRRMCAGCRDERYERLRDTPFSWG